MQAIERHLKTLVSDASERVRILDCVRQLKHCKFANQFLVQWDELKNSLPTGSEVVKYLENNYVCAQTTKCSVAKQCVCTAKLWCNFGTRSEINDRGNDETTNLIEYFFRKFKYAFLSKRLQRRISDMILLILQEVIPYYIQTTMLKYSGRVISLTQRRIRNRDDDVRQILQCPGAIRFIDKSIGHAVVLSMSRKDVAYQVVLAEMRCTCFFAEHNDAVCKHLESVCLQAHYNVRLAPLNMIEHR
jgi:hypothetical protein